MIVILMTETAMLCGNCGRVHCCNFRPISAATTTSMLGVQETHNSSKFYNPKEISSIVPLNEYQLTSALASNLKRTMESPIHRPVPLHRPKSNSKYTPLS